MCITRKNIHPLFSGMNYKTFQIALYFHFALTLLFWCLMGDVDYRWLPLLLVNIIKLVELCMQLVSLSFIIENISLLTSEGKAK